MILLFLDDERNFKDVTWVDYPPYKEVIHVRNFVEFNLLLRNLTRDKEAFEVSFDHDIQEFTDQGEVTGYTILKDMVWKCIDNDIPIPVCYFHTQNPIGKVNMKMYYLQALEILG